MIFKVSKNKFKYLRQLKYIVKKENKLILPDRRIYQFCLQIENYLKQTTSNCRAEVKYIKIFSDKISTLKVLQKNKINVVIGKFQNRQDLLKKIRFF